MGHIGKRNENILVDITGLESEGGGGGRHQKQCTEQMSTK